MKTCDTCKWWKPNGPYLDASGNTWIDDLGQCLSVRILDGHINHRPEDEPKCKPDAVSILADPSARLCTGPKFGCVQHET